MENEGFKYDAFISYRHNDLDKYVAENLHRLIETYKMPKSVVEKFNITDNNVRRVFRDDDELPLASNLENSIIEALKVSKFLIVICSPRLKESIWCKKEIENFIKFHGRSNILCVLVEGEPKDSFPEILQYYEEKVKSENGEETIKTVPCEPLAMDVRGRNKKEIYNKLKKELIRIIAPMYNLDYDDIKQRHEERELKRKANIFKTIAITSLLFAVYSIFLFSRIYISSKQLKYDQSINLSKEASELLLKDNRIGAIEKAYQSVTKYNNIEMPITAKGIYELTDSLGLYYLPEFYYPISQLDTLGIVEYIKTDSDNNYILSYDSSGELVLWDLNNETRIKTINDTKQSTNEDSFTFIGNKCFAYINKDKEIVVLDLQGNEIKRIKMNYSVNNIISSENGKFVEINNSNTIYIYETDSFNEIAVYELPDDKSIIDRQYFDEKGENLIFVETEKNASYYTNSIEIISYNITDKKVISSISINAGTVKQILIKDDNAIVLSSRRYKKGTDMIITSYNYKDGDKYYQKEYDGDYASDIKASFPNNSESTLLVAAFDFAYLLDYKTGDEKERFSIGNSEVDLYVFGSNENYALFTTEGDVNIISGNDSRYDVITYIGFYNFNLSHYRKFLYTNKGFYAHTYDNRIIRYGFLKNEDIKEIDYEEKEFDKINSSEKDSIIEEYNFEKKNLIRSMFYSNDKKTLFVTYNYNILEIYNNETKELLKTLEMPENVRFLNSYICKTENNEHIINGTAGGYILNKDFDLIAYIPQLYDYNDRKIILKSDSNHYYEVKKYTEKELINKGKEYLKSRGRYFN